MDIQKMMDAMSASWRNERSKYQMTLGQLVEELEQLAPDTPIMLSDGNGESPGRAMSYRGYYSDLSFEPSEKPITAKAFATEARRALGNSFEGYKGGEYIMGTDTPLWISEYGCSSGRAVMGLTMSNGIAYLQIKQVD